MVSIISVTPVGGVTVAMSANRVTIVPSVGIRDEGNLSSSICKNTYEAIPFLEDAELFNTLPLLN